MFAFWNHSHLVIDFSQTQRKCTKCCCQPSRVITKDVPIQMSWYFTIFFDNYVCHHIDILGLRIKDKGLALSSILPGVKLGM